MREDNPITVVGIDRPTIDRDLKAIGHKDFVVIDGVHHRRRILLFQPSKPPHSS